MMLSSTNENLRIALMGLRSNKLRAVLTMLGIIIGVATVVILLSLGQGVQTYITNQFESLGANTIRVFATADENGLLDNITSREVEALSDSARAPSIRVVMPQTSGNYAVVYSDSEFSVSVDGVTTDYPEVNSRSVDVGRFFTAQEYQESARVAVLGVGTVNDLFGNADPVGERIRIGTIVFDVIGVLNDNGGNGNDVVVIPLTTAQTRLVGTRTIDGQFPVNSISLLATDNSQVEVAVDEATRVLRDVRGLGLFDADNFFVFSASTILDSLTSVIEAFTIFLGVIAGISLLVGGIGVMNIMLVTVNERTREIGLRKAVGAQSNDIVIQFLVEAVVITVTGGLIGIVIALVVSGLVTSLVPGFDVVVQLTSMILAVVISISVGVFFGVYPARRASRLNPIDSLRYE